MSATAMLIHLMGAVALLLWGMRMVRTGMERAFGANLRRFMGRYVGHRLSAFGAGLGVTSLLQSSTATCLITASFASRGLIATAPGLAIMLGADVGTTLVAQVLSLDMSFLSPILIFAGFVAFSASGTKRARDLGRVAIGLGLMLLSLGIIVETSAPMQDSPVVGIVIRSLADEPLLAIMVAAILTWLAHSSLATVLLVMSMAGSGAISPALGLILVLGANVGGTIAPIVATAAFSAPARRVAIGNALMKISIVILVLPFAEALQPIITMTAESPARQMVNAHTAFNLLVALMFLPLVGALERLLTRLLKEHAEPGDDDTAPRYLERAALNEPSMALANASRETLRMGDTIDRMLRTSLEVFTSGDRTRLQEITVMERKIDRLFEGIKLYLTELRREALEEDENKRCGDIMQFATNLEYCGDIVEGSLRNLATKKIKNQLSMSTEGQAEIERIYQRLQQNLQLSMSVFISGDRTLARRLLREKEQFRVLEKQALDSHHKRLEEGRTESISTSSLHLDMVRDLKRLNGLLSTAAYPILEEAGELRTSRLRKSVHAE
ncbi:Na/Pi cotransporter family protein [Fodinicurvata sp. EGI_FJ10296]|uniref:Na/Pi cotransporter family protein n=1 Tax=Fodinicurvata sp. EGI_FJ10296 TaxID=3231908 RepID=UPI0034572476